MKKLATLIAAALLLATPAHAIVGGGTPQADGVARAVVTIVGSRGNFCTGSLIAPKLVLTVGALRAARRGLQDRRTRRRRYSRSC